MMDLEANAQFNLVHAIAASPNFASDGICFATRLNGVARSQDGGHTWEDALAGLNLAGPPHTLAVVLSPEFASDGCVFVGASGAVLRSADFGRTWYLGTLVKPPPLVSSLVISPTFSQDGVLLAGTVEDGVFYSGDRGVHWASWNFGLLDLNVLDLAISPQFGQDEIVFAATGSGLYRSHNGGRAWREVGVAAGPSGGDLADSAPFLCVAVSPAFAVDGVVFAGSETDGLLRSVDGGKHWQTAASQLPPGAVEDIVLSPAYPQEPHLLVLHEEGLLVSWDDGRVWQPLAVDLPRDPNNQPARITAVCAPLGLGPGAALLVGFSDGGLRRTILEVAG